MFLSLLGCFYAHISHTFTNGCIDLQYSSPLVFFFDRACCVYSGIRGEFSPIVRFATEPAEPSAPRSLTVIGHTRTTLQVKWSAAADNGSRITAYRLEYARANPSSAWSSNHRDGFLGETTVRPFANLFSRGLFMSLVFIMLWFHLLPRSITLPKI